jgi:hypothetical protein
MNNIRNFNINARIFLHADDIISLALTITALQLLLGPFDSELKYLDMQININKSLSIRFVDINCKNSFIDHGDNIQWAKIYRYLGVFLEFI